MFGGYVRIQVFFRNICISMDRADPPGSGTSRECLYDIFTAVQICCGVLFCFVFFLRGHKMECFDFLEPKHEWTVFVVFIMLYGFCTLG